MANEDNKRKIETITMAYCDGDAQEVSIQLIARNSFGDLLTLLTIPEIIRVVFLFLVVFFVKVMLRLIVIVKVF